MNLRNTTTLAATAAVLMLTQGCSRAPIEAIEMSNKADDMAKVDPGGAIEKYQQASLLDPTNHVILAKMAKAYEKREEWDNVASTMSRAVSIAPDFANYWFKRGYALIKKAEGDNNNKDAYEEAKEPLKKCIEKDPAFADCYHFLGQASLWTLDFQGAVDNFSKAIEHDPSVEYFYVELADLYVTYRLYKEAEQVLKQGVEIIPLTDKTRENLYSMNVLLGSLASAQGDTAGALAALERANSPELAGDAHPESAFYLGSTYAVADPPQKDKASRLLNSFNKRACKGGGGKKFADQCAQTASLLQKFGGEK